MITLTENAFALEAKAFEKTQAPAVSGINIRFDTMEIHPTACKLQNCGNCAKRLASAPTVAANAKPTSHQRCTCSK